MWVYDRAENNPMSDSSDERSDRPELPGPDADAATIMRWMEEDFTRSLIEGISSTRSSDTTSDGGEGSSGDGDSTSTEGE